MIIYYEKKAEQFPLTQDLLSQFPHTDKIAIHHYKDLFDKTIGNYPTEPCIILAKQDHISILKTPENYGHPGTSFFFKPSINCIFDCSYCYLKGSFKNRFPVIFVNYEEIQTAISHTIDQERKSWNQNQITFYASNYSDLLAMENRTQFHQHFLPFFEQFDEQVLMETRTKSDNIQPLLQLAQPEKKIKNTEIAFSLSPQTITDTYEPGTATLEKKLHAIQKLLSVGYRIGLRFLPLLPIQNHLQIYEELIISVKKLIDTDKISSIGIAPLIYNKADYSTIQNTSSLPFLQDLHEHPDGMMRMDKSYYHDFKQLFDAHFPQHRIFFDYQ